MSRYDRDCINGCNLWGVGRGRRILESQPTEGLALQDPEEVLHDGVIQAVALFSRALNNSQPSDFIADLVLIGYRELPRSVF